MPAVHRAGLDLRSHCLSETVPVNIYMKAADFAAHAHREQVRRYTGRPYVEHCRAVADLVSTKTQDLDVLAAAVLHDVLEDTATGFSLLEREFGTRVAGLVAELTDKYTTALYPSMSRALRKEAERDRLSKTSAEARLIKWADLTDNAPSIMEHDPKFAVVYLREASELFAAIKA